MTSTELPSDSHNHRTTYTLLRFSCLHLPPLHSSLHRKPLSSTFIDLISSIISKLSHPHILVSPLIIAISSLEDDPLAKQTKAKGRRLCATKACGNPITVEIGDCCSHLKIPFAVELDKAYPRDFMQVGRVRFILKWSDGSLYDQAISSKKYLMLHVAELVPRHPSRVKKQVPAATSTTGPSKSRKGGNY
ncbi:unnamed protein product [Lactuca saligna]|uniref:Uncharacterized protein n=1 Tax=Lactuca saligna TaxID=75948 RepID=A0AA36EIK4_LACSI|nr:unnamed protein product [Lactuca saligna]